MPKYILDKAEEVQNSISELENQINVYASSRMSALSQIKAFEDKLQAGIDVGQTREDMKTIEGFADNLRRRYTQRVEVYIGKVREGISWKSQTQTILTILAITSVILVWCKMRSLRKKFIL